MPASANRVLCYHITLWYYQLFIRSVGWCLLVWTVQCFVCCMFFLNECVVLNAVYAIFFLNLGSERQKKHPLSWTVKSIPSKTSTLCWCCKAPFSNELLRSVKLNLGWAVCVLFHAVHQNQSRFLFFSVFHHPLICTTHLTFTMNNAADTPCDFSASEKKSQQSGVS